MGGFLFRMFGAVAGLVLFYFLVYGIGLAVVVWLAAKTLQGLGVL